jgi:hypothetical protein
VFAGLDASRRVGWAKYFDEVEYSRQLQTLCDLYRDRIEVLVPEFLVLVESVLHERNVEAFNRAWRVQTLIDEYQRGAPH